MKPIPYAIISRSTDFSKLKDKSHTTNFKTIHIICV
ncbi:hypothetical protein BMETH_1375_1 [methanotrophic bacterial endosymbiont of Bathymodiolus sp.]|nr:hypothetical protein BMETH_1375_1 [methanotrophic bacterial endosymbiont of Bathymodiolus sp.]